DQNLVELDEKSEHYRRVSDYLEQLMRGAQSRMDSIGSPFPANADAATSAYAAKLNPMLRETIDQYWKAHGSIESFANQVKAQVKNSRELEAMVQDLIARVERSASVEPSAPIESPVSIDRPDLVA